MRWLYRVTLALVLGFATLMVLIRTTRQAPSPLVATLFTNPDGTACQQPCLLGIQAETPYEETFALLKRHPFTRQLNVRYGPGAHELLYRGAESSVTLSGPDGRLVPPLTVSADFRPAPSGKELDATVPGVRLGEIVILLGQPEAVVIDPDLVWLPYYHGHLLIGVQRRIQGADRLDAYTSVLCIVLSSAPQGIRLHGNRTPWDGFSDYQ